VGQPRHSLCEILFSAHWLYPARYQTAGVRIAIDSIVVYYTTLELDAADHIDHLVARVESLSVMQVHLMPSRASIERESDGPGIVIAAIHAVLCMFYPEPTVAPARVLGFEGVNHPEIRETVVKST